MYVVPVFVFVSKLPSFVQHSCTVGDSDGLTEPFQRLIMACLSEYSCWAFGELLLSKRFDSLVDVSV